MKIVELKQDEMMKIDGGGRVWRLTRYFAGIYTRQVKRNVSSMFRGAATGFFKGGIGGAITGAYKSGITSNIMGLYRGYKNRKKHWSNLKRIKYNR